MHPRPCPYTQSCQRNTHFQRCDEIWFDEDKKNPLPSFIVINCLGLNMHTMGARRRRFLSFSLSNSQNWPQEWKVEISIFLNMCLFIRLVIVYEGKSRVQFGEFFVTVVQTLSLLLSIIYSTPSIIISPTYLFTGVYCISWRFPLFTSWAILD